MLELKIDEERCIQCGECAKDCPVLCISMTEDGLPVAAQGREDQCIDCRHCLAVCPTAALTVNGVDPEDSLEIKDAFPDAGQMRTLIEGRRSVRRFMDEPVDAETMTLLMDTLGSAPTGVNNRATLFTLVDDPEVMDAVRRETLAGIRKVMDGDGLPKGFEFFGNFVELWENKGVDVIFRRAPHMLVVTSPTSGPSPQADCYIALSYFDLLAASMGLGALWDGLAVWAMDTIVPAMRSRLGIPRDHCTGYAMLFGYPAVSYHRTVQRGPGLINRVRLDT